MLALGSDAVAYGGLDGDLVVRSLGDGAEKYRVRGVCRPSPGTHDGPRIDALLMATQIVVGCGNGDVVAIERGTGRLLTRAADGSLDRIDRIEPIAPNASCAYAVDGTSDGAMLASQLELLDCRGLRTIESDAVDARLLGAVGDVAVLADRCCRAYQPVDFETVDLRNGHESAELPRTPSGVESENERSEAMLAGSSLVVFAGGAMYRYGDVRKPGRPVRDALALIDVPQIMQRGTIAARLGHDDSDAVDAVLRIGTVGASVVWRARETFPAVFGYDAVASPDTVTLLRQDAEPNVVVDIRRGRTLTIEAGCGVRAGDARGVVSLCTTNRLVGTHFEQDLVATRWGP